jgi:hypothetical protein
MAARQFERLPARHAKRILERLINGSRHALTASPGRAAEQLQLELMHARARVLDLEASLSWRSRGAATDIGARMAPDPIGIPPPNGRRRKPDQAFST